MTNQLSSLEIKILFNKMEIDEHLFELTYKNQFSVWDLIRRDVYIQIVSTLSNVPIGIPYSITTFDKYKNIFRKIHNQIILYVLRSKRAQNLAIVHRRSKEKSRKYDFATDPIANKLNDFFYVDLGNPSLFKAIIFRDTSFLCYKVIREMYNDIEAIAQHIDKSVSKNFNIKFNSKEIVNYGLNCFFSGKLFFSNLIESLKCQKVFYSDNGILKCIPYSCNIKKIKSFEVQHGAAPGSTIMTYPKSDKLFLNKNNCYYSDYLLLWSKYWKNIYSTPSKFIVTGTYNYIDKCDHLDNILFISSKVHNFYLSSFAKGLSYALPNKKIFFKLHPEQFYELSKIKEDFKFHSNVTVITDEISNNKLLQYSSDFVAIQSSLVYQALQSGCRGHIINLRNGLNDDQEVFKYCSQSSNVNELLQNLNKKTKQSTCPIFYEKLNMKSLENYL